MPNSFETTYFSSIPRGILLGLKTYLFSFNGKKNDCEVEGQQDYSMRIVKFKSVDPLIYSYPMLTTYQFASNRPIKRKKKMNIETSKKQNLPTSTHGRNSRYFRMIGIVTFLYCIFPVIQFHLFSGIAERFNNYYIFVFSMMPFEFMELIYTNSFLPYLIQLLLWLFYWSICYNFLIVLKKV